MVHRPRAGYLRMLGDPFRPSPDLSVLADTRTVTASQQPRVGPPPPADVFELIRRVLAPAQATATMLLYEVRSTSLRMEQTVLTWLGSDAVSPSRMHVLMVLAAADRPVPQMHIVRALDVSRASVSRLVDGLQHAGLVATTPSQDDKRHALVQLTPAGTDLTNRRIQQNADHMTRALGDLTAAEQSQLLDLLLRVRHSFEAHGPDVESTTPSDTTG